MVDIAFQPSGILSDQRLFQNSDLPGLLGAPKRLGAWSLSFFILPWLGHSQSRFLEG